MGIDDYMIANTNFNRQLTKHNETLKDALITSDQPDNHAPTIAVHQRKVYLVWFAGSEEGNGDVSIYMSILDLDSSDQSESPLTWSEPRKISSQRGYSCQNPIIVASNNLLTLYHTIHPGKDSYPPKAVYTQEQAIVVRRVSQDDGQTWSLKQVLFEGQPSGFFIRAPPLRLDNNLLFPVSWTPTNTGEHYASVMKLTDNNQSLEYPIPESNLLTQPCLIKTDDNFQIYLRDRRSEYVYRATSLDGLIWSDPEPTEMLNNNSGIAFIYLGQGRILGVINPVRQSRCPLTVVLSIDNGSSWHLGIDLASNKLLNVPDDMIFDENYGPEVSYPTLAQDKTNGDLHLAYTFCHGGIKYVYIPKEVWEGWFQQQLVGDLSVEGLLQQVTTMEIADKIMGYSEYLVSIEHHDNFEVTNEEANLPEGQSWGSDKYDGYIIKTNCRIIKFGIGNEQNCCEQWGNGLKYNGEDLPNEALKSMFGTGSVSCYETILTIHLIDLSNDNDHDNDDYDDYNNDHLEIRLKIQTNLGLYQFTMFNDHNGYYSHEVIYYNNGELQQMSI